jgi:hypothetical protein
VDAYHIISDDRRQAEYDLRSSSSSSSYVRTFTSCWASSSLSYGYGYDYDIWWFILATASFRRR